MSEVYSRNLVEAALLAAGRSLTLNELVQVFDPLARPQVEELREVLAAIASEYEARGIELKETASEARRKKLVKRLKLCESFIESGARQGMPDGRLDPLAGASGRTRNRHRLVLGDMMITVDSRDFLDQVDLALQVAPP